MKPPNTQNCSFFFVLFNVEESLENYKKKLYIISESKQKLKTHYVLLVDGGLRRYIMMMMMMFTKEKAGKKNCSKCF